MAVLGFGRGANLSVDPQARWHGSYVPAVLRSHPFVMARSSDGQMTLCIGEESGLLVDIGQGEPKDAS